MWRSNRKSPLNEGQPKKEMDKEYSFKLEVLKFIIIHQTYYEKISLVESIQSIHNSLWTWHYKCNICCRYCFYHVKFNVCLLSKPLVVFSSETKCLNASLLFLRMNYMWKMYNKTIIEFGFCMISWIIKTLCVCYLPKHSDLSFDNSWHHAQLHPIIV